MIREFHVRGSGFWPSESLLLNWSLFLFSTWHQTQYALCPERKFSEMAARIVGKLRTMNKHTICFHLSLEKLPLVRMSASWFLGVNIFWYGSWVPSWFCQTTNQEQLCEFLTHVSLWDFVLWLSFWSQVHCLQKCTAETLLEKNGCGWVSDWSTFSFLVTCWVLVWESRTAPLSWWQVCLSWTLSLVECKISITMSHRSRASIPSIRCPASREMTSDSAE